MKVRKTTAPPCPCGKGLYAECCAPLHEGTAAGSAEALMRSRYSAYVLKLSRYLLDTWHPETRLAELELTDDTTQWLKLEIRRHEQADDAATVEFVARYKLNGRACRLHEISRFVRQDTRWYYLNGELFD
jgi:SEC-C motif-containing protein